MTDDKTLAFIYFSIYLFICLFFLLKIPVSSAELATSVKRPNLKRSKTLGLSSIDNSYNLEVKSPLSNGKNFRKFFSAYLHNFCLYSRLHSVSASDSFYPEDG